MEFTGKVLNKTQIEAIWAQGLSKQSLIIEEASDKQYKDSIMIEFFGDKCGLISDVRTDDIVKVLFNPRAKEYNGRRYNSMNGWKIEIMWKASWQQAASGGSQQQNASFDDNDDLPF